MKILFIGGTGVISSACSELCIERGHQLFLLNRGKSFRAIPKGAAHIEADINDKDMLAPLLRKEIFDVVVDWVAYEPGQVKRDFELFRDKTGQYIFISSASAYKKPLKVPVDETHPLENSYWDYSRNKILCEQLLNELHDEHSFPVTIVRPSHTYDKTKIALFGEYTALDRILNRKKTIIHGDGTSFWTFTHHKDFAKGFIGLFDNPEAIGEAFHITSDEFHTWDEICRIYGEALGVEPNIVHIPSDLIAKHDKSWGENLIGDKAFSAIFDNSKIKKLNPDFRAEISLAQGVKETVEWFKADKTRQMVDESVNRMMDELVLSYESIYL